MQCNLCLTFSGNSTLAEQQQQNEGSIRRVKIKLNYDKLQQKAIKLAETKSHLANDDEEAIEAQKSELDAGLAVKPKINLSRADTNDSEEFLDIKIEDVDKKEMFMDAKEKQFELVAPETNNQDVYCKGRTQLTLPVANSRKKSSEIEKYKIYHIENPNDIERIRSSLTNEMASENVELRNFSTGIVNNAYDNELYSVYEPEMKRNKWRRKSSTEEF